MNAELLAFALWAETCPVSSVKEGLHVTSAQRFEEWKRKPEGERLTWMLRARTVLRIANEVRVHNEIGVS